MHSLARRPPASSHQLCLRAILRRNFLSSSRLRKPPDPTKPPSSSPTPPPSTTPSAPTPASRLARLQSRLPARLRPLLTPILHAPLSHVAAFLLLHELTAIVPLLGLTAAFHYGGGSARAKEVVEARVGPEKLNAGLEKMERWFRRRGWLADGEEGRGRVGNEESVKSGGAAVVAVELATAYAVTKALLPVRLAASVWATPWFARVCVVPCASAFRRLGAWREVRWKRTKWRNSGERHSGSTTRTRDPKQ